jgi:1-acyl-sn-glycerol-3-phosphate acyltransferase
LQAAIATDTAVQPLALRYEAATTGAISVAPAYVGDDSLLDTLWRTVRTPGLRVRLKVGVPERAQGRERRQWAQDLRNEVSRIQSAAADACASNFLNSDSEIGRPSR